MPIQTDKLKLLMNPNLPYKTRKGQGGKSYDYITLRQAQMLFDVVVGAENWTCSYHDIGGRLMCKIGINIEGQGWVYKEDCGSDSNIEGEKGGISDAFKRAAVAWGVGRFLYPEVTEPIRKLWAQLNTKEAPSKEKSPAPKQESKPAPKSEVKKTAPKAVAKPEPMSKKTQEALIAAAKTKGWDNKQFAAYLFEEHMVKWAELNEEIAQEVLNALNGSDSEKMELARSIEEKYLQVVEDGLLEIEQMEKFSKEATGHEYVSEENCNSIDLDHLVILEGELKDLIKHGESFAPTLIERYKLV